MVRGVDPISDRSKLTVVCEPETLVAVTANFTSPWNAGTGAPGVPL